MRSLRNIAQQLAKVYCLVLCILISLAHSAKITKSDFKLVCYYANWAIYRPGHAKFTPENINPFLCTHLIYAFAGMNKNYELKPFDSYNDIQLGNYQKFTNLKTYNPKLKVMIAIGGWNEGSKRFSKMVESSSDRQRFVRSAVSFLRKHGFDGLDLDWEYPGFRDGGQDDDKQGYAKLVKELREAFDSENVPSGKSTLLLTMAVPAGQQYIDKGFDVPVLSKNLDFFNMLTYDYHTAHEPLTNHHAPLKEMPDLEDWDPNRLLNIEWSVKYYIKKGADPKKLVVGIPTYGRSYTLSDPDETDIGSPADGPGEQGEATREKGYLAYYEICQLIQEQDWELEAPYADMMGPFAYKDNQWVGFDDEEIIIEKVKFIVKEGLGGGMVWTLDNDDFRGKCYGEQSPLINTLKTALEQGSALLTQTTTTTAAPKRTTERPSRRTKATSKPTKSTTPPVFTTPEPPQPFECEDEGFFNNPTDCKKYFWCLDSGPSNLGLVAHSFTCPSGLYFNKNRDSCDYAANVVCRVKKVTTTTTTPKPRPRPRTRKTTTKATTTTTTTTITTTPKPSKKKDAESLDKLKGPLNTINMNGENLMELLQLLQQLGVNQIQDKLQGKESVEATSTINPTLPAYRSPNRRRTKAPETTTAKADLFNQYAKPDRSSKDSDNDDDDESKITVRPRGPQYHNSKPKTEDPELDEEDDELEPTSPSDDKSRDGFDFPFVYHTPSRHRSKPTTEVEDVLEDYDDEPTTTTSTAKPTPANRRVVIKVRPIPGENNKRRNNARNPANADKENRRNNYVLAQTIGVRRVARPNVLEEQTTKDVEPQTTSKPVVRRPRPVTSRAPERPTTTTTQRYRSPPAPKELIVLPTGRPAVPATTRRYRTYSAEPREPALALLPDGRITCLRRGVYPHPKDCAKFLVCVPAEQSEDEYDGFIHDCPKNTFFVDKKGRCAPGDRSACSPQEK